MTDGTPERGFSIRSLADLSVVSAPAEITIQNSQQLRQALAEAGSYHPIVVVDMTANEFCDSSGISELVMAQKRARAGTGEVRLVMGASAVRRIFKVTGADSVFRIFEGMPDAVAAEPGLDPRAAGSPQP